MKKEEKARINDLKANPLLKKVNFEVYQSLYR